MVENLVLFGLMHAFPGEEVNYWRTIAKAEVDFVLRLGEGPVPVEVKYQRFRKVKVSRGLRSFIRTYKPKRALVVTREFWAKDKLDGTEVLFVPACYL